MPFDKKIRNDIVLIIVLTITLIFKLSYKESSFLPNFVFASISLIATIPVIFSAVIGLKDKKVTVDLLASVALIFSILNKEWFSAIFINLMIASARIFNHYSENRAQNQIKSLLKLRPTHVKLKTGNSVSIIPLSQLKINDLVIVEVGDRIPADGLVVSGQAAIDQSSLTGESLPVTKKNGDSVLSSTLNVSGSLTIKVEKTGTDTTFEKIIKLIDSAKEQKQGIRTFVEKFSSIYILATFLSAVIIFILFKDIGLVLSLLLVTCADDIAIAIPMAFWIAIAHAAQRGIIIKGGSYLEGLAKSKSIILDKTGTLTQGTLQVSQIIELSRFSTKEILFEAGNLERFSKHPIASAIYLYCQKEKISFPKIPKSFSESPGQGIYSKDTFIGSLEFIKKNNIPISKSDLDIVLSSQNQGHNVVLVAKNRKLIGLILISSELRTNAISALGSLNKLGIEHVVMLTGDNQKVADQVAAALNIKEYHANLMPQDKLSLVKLYLSKETYRKLIYVGDGVNDAASLSISDIGIAMGAIGSDAAIESADIALMNDDLSKIPETISLSHYLAKIVRQNFIIWGLVNTVGLVLVFTHILSPAGAAAYNFISDFFPLLNSFRLFGYKLKPGVNLY